MEVFVAIVQTLSLGGFFYYLIKGLRAKIAALEGVIGAQKQTLDVMERRVQETEKVGNIYRDLLASLPTDIDNFRTVLSKTKDETIVELQNQNEAIKKKLRDAEQVIEGSGQSREVIAIHLGVLRNLLHPPKGKYGSEKKSELVALCEFDGRRLERSVSHLVSSRTFEDFVQALGMRLHVQEDNSVIRTVMADRKAPDGSEMRVFTAGHSLGGGWYCAVNNELFVNGERLSFYKDEFSAAKTVV